MFAVGSWFCGREVSIADSHYESTASIGGSAQGKHMRNRKEKPIGMRLLSSVAAFMLIGAAVYIFVAGMHLYAGVVLAAAVLGLGAHSVSAGENLLEIITGFFEAFLDGVMEVIGGILDAISSLFG